MKRRHPSRPCADLVIFVRRSRPDKYSHRSAQHGVDTTTEDSEPAQSDQLGPRSRAQLFSSGSQRPKLLYQRSLDPAGQDAKQARQVPATPMELHISCALHEPNSLKHAANTIA